MIKKTICVLSISFLISVSYGTDYYVSTHGSDSNAGNIDAPFKTIDKASKVMIAGDTCNIMDGVYREVITPRNNGTENSPITYKAFKNDTVTIDATDILNGWSKYKEDIYKAKLKSDLSIEDINVYHDDSVLDMARWPNNEDNDRFTFDGLRIEKGTDSSISKKGMIDVDMTGGYLCYMGAHCGMTWTRKIISDDSENIFFPKIDIKKWPFNPHNPTVYRNKNRGQLFLFGKMELLDAPKEWFYSDKEETLYAIFPEHKAPKSNSVKISARLHTAQITKDFINVEGLRFFGGPLEISGKNFKIRNSIISNGSQSLDNLKNESAQSRNGNIIVKGEGATIDSNIIEYGSANGVLTLGSGKNVTISNNIVRYFDTLGIHASPIRSSAEFAKITKNTIYTCGRDGISSFGNNSEISYNDIYDCVKINNDGGTFYTVGNKYQRNVKIHHNYFHDSYGPKYADGRCAGIYLDNHSKGYLVHHNVIWDVTWSALAFNLNNENILFYNNTILNAGAASGHWAKDFPMKNIVFINNFSNVKSKDVDWIGTDFKTNYINTERSISSFRDFVPKSDDECLIDKGTVINGITDGYKGKAPDIGAYEFGSKKWKAGSSLIKK